MNIEMSDYPYLLAKLKQHFPKLIIKSYEPSNANSNLSNANLEVSKYNLLDGQQDDFPLSQSIKKGFGVNGLNTFR